MPKIVDHDLRRQELASAVWRLVAEQGVHAVSVRAVAAEAGTSPGALRHYFTSQQELLSFVLEMMYEQIADRLDQRLTASARRAPLTAAQQMIEVLLPLDDQRRAEVAMWMAFSVNTWDSTEPDGLRDDGWNGSAYIARMAVATLHGVPVPPTAGVPMEHPAHEEAARQLQVLVDGWCVQLLFYPRLVTPAMVRAELTATLRRWTTPTDPDTTGAP